MEKEYVKVEPDTETFRGYAAAIDRELEAGGEIAVPFIAFAKMSGADVDHVFVKDDFERHFAETAAEFGMQVIKHDVDSTETATGLSVEEEI